MFTSFHCKYIASRYNQTFSEAFRDHILSTGHSQFCLMLTYLWHYRRDDYTWFAHNETPKGDE
eukprot:gene45039-56064_t